jgi:hypothetical protein
VYASWLMQTREGGRQRGREGVCFVRLGGSVRRGIGGWDRSIGVVIVAVCFDLRLCYSGVGVVPVWLEG